MTTTMMMMTMIVNMNFFMRLIVINFILNYILCNFVVRYGGLKFCEKGALFDCSNIGGQDYANYTGLKLFLN
jgi:hypothetical protein